MPPKPRKTSFSPLVAIVGGCATVFGFWASYGLVSLGLAVLISSLLILYQLFAKEDFGTWLNRSHPKVVKGMVVASCFAGAAMAIFGLFSAEQLADWFRRDIEKGPIKMLPYAASAAPWANVPAAGVSEPVETAFRLNGWKRLMSSALTNDPQNQNPVSKQFLYVESEVFSKSYKSFVAEIELPTSVSISEVYAFLVNGAATRPHDQLQQLRTDCLGVDGNKCHIQMSSPDAGEQLQVFIVASERHNKVIPKDLASNIILRSIE